MSDKAKIQAVRLVINEWRNSEAGPSSTLALNSYMRKIENIIRPYDENQSIVRTKSLGPKATEDLLVTLRPLVYVNGAASNDTHDTHELITIGVRLLDWWTEFNIDDSDKEITE
jgi:hypothetical protein